MEGERVEDRALGVEKPLLELPEDLEDPPLLLLLPLLPPRLEKPIQTSDVKETMGREILSKLVDTQASLTACMSQEGALRTVTVGYLFLQGR